MKKVVAIIISMILIAIVGCGNSQSSSAPTETNDTTIAAAPTTTEAVTVDVTPIPLSGDDLFLQDIAAGLNARWRISTSPEGADSALAEMSVSEYQRFTTSCVNAECSILTDINRYNFTDTALAKLAETYFKALALQKEGIPYLRYTYDATHLSDYNTALKTYILGNNYRTVVLYNLYMAYNLTVDPEYQEIYDDFLASYPSAQKSIALAEYAAYLEENLEYSFDSEKSTKHTTYYTAIVENTTAYEINTMSIQVSFLDKDGVIVYQGFDNINNLKPGAKYRSSVYAGNNPVASAECSVTIYSNLN